MQNLLLSCDWGSSNFRLKLVDRNSNSVVDQTKLDQGVAFVFSEWKQSSNKNQENFFLEKLGRYIRQLTEKTKTDLQHLPVIVSGMASSTIGIRELKYADLPYSLDGKNALVEKIFKPSILNNEIWLLSGVRDKRDVMRGEETQIIGISDLLQTTDDDLQVCILPGTHSKHIIIKNNQIVQFKTYLTGELFGLLSKHGILSQSVIEAEPEENFGEELLNAFKKGITASENSDLLNSLFSVRTNQLFSLFSLEQNFYYLSGLLIGTELRTLKSNKKLKIKLCAGSNVNHLYQLALQELDLYNQTTHIATETMDNAAMHGQIKILTNQHLKASR